MFECLSFAFLSLPSVSSSGVSLNGKEPSDEDSRKENSILQIPILAAGGVDRLVHLFVEREGKFEELLSLQGHEDWIRSVQFCTSQNYDDPNNLLLLATSSQDNKIRIWRIVSEEADPSISEANLTTNWRSSKSSVTTISSQWHFFQIGAHGFNVILESVLSGHEDWVLSVMWQFPYEENGKYYQPMSLLSSSMDRTMMIWHPNQETDLWINDVRVGEMGGNMLGFYGGLFSPDGYCIIAHGYNGAFHLWRKDIQTQAWQPQVTVSGHFSSVSDLCWDPSFHYLISVSEDQTARLFAPWIHRETNITDMDIIRSSIETSPPFLNSLSYSWHEIARPQLHGHDMNCIAFVNGRNHQFASGAEEKVIRVFDATQTFVDSLESISGLRFPKEERALGANVPPLGLSNKPTFQETTENISEFSSIDILSNVDNHDNDHVDQHRLEIDFEYKRSKKFEEDNKDILVNYGTLSKGTGAPAAIVHTYPPAEEHLMQDTLWPEIRKLYGHPNEVVCICSNRKGTLLASSCKGSQSSECIVRLWSTISWKEVCQLAGHKLTVVQMSFSYGDDMLLTVSRDRQFCMFSFDNDTMEKVTAVLIAKVKAHERIIWSCDWSPDDVYFATASRDKSVKIWTKANTTNQWNCCVSLPLFSCGVTAVSWAPLISKKTTNSTYYMGVGLEDGSIHLWIGIDCSWNCLLTFPLRISHTKTVKRLQWRKVSDQKTSYSESQSPSYLQLASCSADQSVRVFNVVFSYK